MKNKHTVLIADDESINIRIIAEALKEDNEIDYKLIIASNGLEVIECVKKDKPDLILLDIQMPELDGYEVCKILKQDKETKDIPIIFITAKATAGEELFGFKIGAVDYISKPFNPIVVRARAKTHLKLKQHENELASLVKQRTKDLSKSNRQLKEEIIERARLETERIAMEEKLGQSQKLEAVGTMASGIAHDFNNILLPINCYTEMVMMGMKEEDENKDHLQQVLNAVKIARNIVEQLMKVGRRKTVNDTGIKNFLSLNNIISDIVNLLKVDLQKNIKISFTPKEDENLVLANSTQIHQVFMNICKNGIHSMEKTNGMLKIEIEEILIEEEFAKIHVCEIGMYARIKITDTGSGMNEDTLSKIFDPYFTTKKYGKGTGLGLSMARGIIMEHGGDVTVESTTGSGTCFAIYLPLGKL